MDDLNVRFLDAVNNAFIIWVRLHDSDIIVGRAWWIEENTWVLRRLEDGTRRRILSQEVESLRIIGAYLEDYEQQV
ncbi:hypothetical protein GWO60_03785 [Corynebacterium macginleyi]|uniref:hypothetical protein n=1 Tax=Corynebacterium macginleyi TaxID=38290 RepID=UPI001909B429|nr:hypothetical protein [Corynebacterium macginleyi]MBK4163652.1 hypothetical protein [Corynebacterium macginleyi]MBK4173711.1 hypothetical protein [Corynebacterium macginleyi]QRJ59314.1 hypothetical protein GWO70_007330 [Corynebacterium macginleyi]